MSLADRRTERLLAILLVLLRSARPLTRGEIFDQVRDYPREAKPDAFERMFERDKDELRLMGFPIESVASEETEGTAYRLLKSQALLDPIQVDPAERVVLSLAAGMWDEANWGHDALNALRKLETAGDLVGHEDPAVGFSFTVRGDIGVMTSVLDARKSKSRVSFKYRKSGASGPEVRTVEPWGIVTVRATWYLVGNDVDRQAVRAFRLSRVDGIITVKKPVGAFEIPENVDLRSLVADSFPAATTIDATVALTPGRCDRLRSLADEVTRDIASFQNVNPDQLLPEVLAAGVDAVVVQPADLRRAAEQALVAISTAPDGIDPGKHRALRVLVDKARRPPTEAASARLSRMLALVPWLANHPGVTHQLAADHFGVSVETIMADLNLAVCTEFGAYHSTMAIEFDGHTIRVTDAQGIEAPFRLTPTEAVSLLIGLRLLEQIPGPHDRTALRSVVEKIETASPSAATLVDMIVVGESGPSNASAEVIEAIAAALRDGRAMQLSYWSRTSDVTTERVIDPLLQVTTRGVTYLQAWCRRANDMRLFRIDGIRHARVLAEPNAAPPDLELSTPSATPAGVETIFEIDPAISWWLDQVSAQATLPQENGTQLVSMLVADQQWAMRTALAFGGQMRILFPEQFAASLRRCAADTLVKYAK